MKFNRLLSFSLFFSSFSLTSMVWSPVSFANGFEMSEMIDITQPIQFLYKNKSEGTFLNFQLVAPDSENIFTVNVIDPIIRFMQSDYASFKIGLEKTSEGIRGLGKTASGTVDFYTDYANLERYEINPNNFAFKGLGTLKILIRGQMQELSVNVLFQHK